MPAVVSTSAPPPLATRSTLAVFGAGAVLLLAVAHGLIPTAAARTGVEPVVWWFVLGGLGVFVPLLLLAFVLLRREGALGRPGLWRERLRFRPMTRRDWGWALGGLVATGALSAAAMAALGGAAQPAFMTLEPLGPGRYWLLAAWLPFWVLNIMGEEVLWRGVVLPRQEAAFGGGAWAMNGAGWLLFHTAFGWPLVGTLAPICVIAPWVAQRTGNSWTAVVIHAGLNGPGFVAVALGLV